MRKKRFFKSVGMILFSGMLGFGMILPTNFDASATEAVQSGEEDPEVVWTEESQDNSPGLLEKDDFQEDPDWRLHYSQYLKRLHVNRKYPNYKYKIKFAQKGHNSPYLVIKQYTGSKTVTTIPSVIQSTSVRVIAKDAFKNNKTLKSIRISDRIYKIEKGAFSGCKAKIVKPSYLKKQKDGSYEAKAFVKIPGRKKKVSYKASKVTKIKGTRNVTVRKNKKKKIYTSVYYAGKRKTGFLDYSILKFTSSNKKVATVSKYGNIKGIKKGTATITVKLRTTGKGYRMKVKVR